MDEDIDATMYPVCLFYQIEAVCAGGQRATGCSGLPAGSKDLANCCGRDIRVLTLTFAVSACVLHHYKSAMPGQAISIGEAQRAPAAGHKCHPIRKNAHCRPPFAFAWAATWFNCDQRSNTDGARL
jgi:hypothetical protein